MEIVTKVETITPERAQQLLATLSPKQRLQRKHHLNYLRSEIDGGHWKLNGETIKITPEGKVIDGQHRLAAVVASGKPIETIVVFGVDENVYNSIDTGLRRNAADALLMRGETNVTTLSSAIGICYAVDNEKYWNVMSRNRSGIVTEEYLDRNKRIRESTALASANYTRLIHPSLVAAIHYIYTKRKADPELLQRFVVGLKDGFVPMKEWNFHKFRERLIANAAAVAKVRRNIILAWAFITINATLTKQRLTRLEWNPKTEDFPKPTVIS